MTLLSISTLCCRRWCSLVTTPTTRRESRREALMLHLREVQADRSLDRVSAGPLHDVNRRGDRSLRAMNHNLSRGLSPSVGSYISLRNRERPVRVTGRRGSPLPRQAAASVASWARRAEAHRPGREDVPRIAFAEASRRRPRQLEASTRRYLPQLCKHGHWAKECRQPRRGQAHVAHVEEEPALLLANASIELYPAASAATDLLHLDEQSTRPPRRQLRQ
jgi:hypothetical protein